MSSSAVDRLSRDKPSIYTFARWDRSTPPPQGMIATFRDLQYYLRVANCGNGITVSALNSVNARKLNAAKRYLYRYARHKRVPCSIWKRWLGSWRRRNARSSICQ